MLSSPCQPAIILHGRRLALSPTQAQVLEALLAQRGRPVADADLLTPRQRTGRRLTRAISRLRPVVEPHGLAIYRVQGAGYLLTEAP
ncbi:MAG: helix-turn-helix domain-containing protein [Ktedonobacteraceae bacterium]